ncbi:unnamed protein product, partial [Didymodactylos carnosus]
IVKARVENSGLPIVSLFPTLSNTDAWLYRRRAINYPKLPTTINEISLNGSWKLDENAGDFLLVDETSEESDIQTRKRKKIYNDIDNKLKQVLISHSSGMLTNVQLAIKCGRAVKTNPAKK